LPSVAVEGLLVENVVDHLESEPDAFA